MLQAGVLVCGVWQCLPGVCSHSMCCVSLRSQLQQCLRQTATRNGHPSQRPRMSVIHHNWTYPIWRV